MLTCIESGSAAQIDCAAPPPLSYSSGQELIERKRDQPASFRSEGNRITSRRLGLFVSNIISGGGGDR